MWRLLRHHANHSNKLYINDSIALAGKPPSPLEFLCHRTAAALPPNFEAWIQGVYRHRQQASRLGGFKSLPVIHFVYAAANDNNFPLQGLIKAGRDQHQEYFFALTRLLANPVAREFRSLLPWLYSESIERMQKFAQFNWEMLPEKEICRKLNNLRFTSAKLTRRYALETATYSLQTLSLRTFWNLLPLNYSLNEFLSYASEALLGLEKESFALVRFPLPGSENMFQALIFWLQLLEITLISKFKCWEIYWHGQGRFHKPALIFSRSKLSVEQFELLLDPEAKSDNFLDLFQLPDNYKIQTKFCALGENIDLELNKLLALWGKLLILEIFGRN